ncbi:MAG: hypothetical protein WC729_25640 [Sphingomonas sp.]|jgi:hypothetical protein|uniref:hypothetical protein n=1 Tax=Sphingomonas sp. TaxID=28214 RepID=UPI0035623FE2
MTDNPEQIATSETIVDALEALRGEVSLNRHALERLISVREQIPDYSVTLGQMVKALKEAVGGIDRIEASPGVNLSPAAFTAEIVKAGADARAEDRSLIRETRDAMSRSIGRVDGIVERGQAADQQVKRLIWAGVVGSIIGMFLWSVLPGAIARSLPASWHIPEWMAKRTMGMDGPHAAARLIQASGPPTIEMQPSTPNDRVRQYGTGSRERR